MVADYIVVRDISGIVGFQFFDDRGFVPVDSPLGQRLCEKEPIVLDDDGRVIRSNRASEHI